MDVKNHFEPADIEAFMPAEKIALVASVNPEGLPHITLITSMRASGPEQLTLGEFCKGRSKTYIQERPRIGFLIMTMDRRMWRGRAVWTHLRQNGPEFDSYNDLPTFRYNSYFGINTVHYLDLVEFTGPGTLPLSGIIKSTLMTRIARGGAGTGNSEPVLKPLGQTIFNRLDALKFLAYVNPDGFPVLIPVIQCQAADSRRLVFHPGAYQNELKSIPAGTPMAVFGLTMSMEDVLVRGIFAGYRTSRLVSLGVLDIDWVYNSMPPCHGQIYPEVPLTPVTEF
ncbi:MAG: pyridoxamine 5'-phosphate oxidase family protein [Desulfobacteraceae bacterium]|jgi:hypothetical protein